MSEERRRKKQERDGTKGRRAPSRKVIVYGVIVLLFAAAYSAGRYWKNHRYEAFAKCLATHQARMYGLYWCPHCIEQKEMFGASFKYVPYVECAIKGSRELAPECKAAGAKNFPSWQFNGGALHEGALSMEDLSARSACPLPQ
jgi:hypothetical protein